MKIELDCQYWQKHLDDAEAMENEMLLDLYGIAKADPEIIWNAAKFDGVQYLYYEVLNRMKCPG